MSIINKTEVFMKKSLAVLSLMILTVDSGMLQAQSRRGEARRNGQCMEQIQRLRSELVSAHSENSNLNLELLNVKDYNASLSHDLQQCQEHSQNNRGGRVKKLKEENHRLTKKVAKLKAKNKNLKSRIHELEDELNGSYDPAPFPLPRPFPRTNVEAKGRIENIKFHFSGQNSPQIFNQCVNFVETFSTTIKVDDVHVSTNNGKRAYLRNRNDFWRSADSICAQVESAVVDELNNPTNLPTGYYFVTGKIEKQSFRYEGSNGADIFNSCVEDVENSMGNSVRVDDAYVSVNGNRREHSRNESSFWTNSDTVCEQVAKYVR